MTASDGPILALPKVEVVLDDGRTETVQVLNADLLRWDRTAAKHGWPHFETAKAWHSTFLAWSALRRTGTIPESWTWEEFSEEHCVQVQGVAANGDGPDGVDPTQSEAEPE